MKEKASDVHIKDSKFLGGDAFRIAFLTILYMVQGIWFGFLGNTLPVRFKKTFDYAEIGTISWWFLPYSFKFILAPLVDTIYSKWIGKRRTWIIPTQLIMWGIVYYFSYYLKDLIEEKSIFLITIWFTIILWCWALQDISIDGWWVTIVKQENAKYSALAQMTGINLGIFVSTTVFFAFNSLDFCKSYLYLEESEVSPIIDEFSFMRYWSIIIFAISLYTILFSSETKDRIKYEEREIGIIEAISRIFILLGNKKILKLILLFIVVLMFSNVNTFLGNIYCITLCHLLL